MKANHAFVLTGLLTATIAGCGQGIVADSAMEINPLGVGDTVPNAKVRTADDDGTKLRDAMAGKPTVLVFYRGGWCPFCSRHLSDLATVQSQIEALGYQLIAISPDRPAKAAELARSKDLGFPLLSDSDMRAAKAFGLAFKENRKTLEKYETLGIDLDVATGRSHHQQPVPAVYVVGADGRIIFVHTDPDYRRRMTGADIVSTLKTLAGQPE